MKCSLEASRHKSKRFSNSFLGMCRLHFSPLLCQMRFLVWPNISWEIQRRFLSRVKTWLLKVLVSTILQLKRRNGRLKCFLTSMLTWISTRLWSTVTQRREFSIWKNKWTKTISQFPQCTEKWTKSKEILSWRNSELELLEFSSPLTCWQEVLMSSKLVSLSTTNFLSRRKTTFIELVEPVDSEERVSLLTLSHQTMLDSSEKSRIITTQKSKKCLRTWRNSTPTVPNDDIRSI